MSRHTGSLGFGNAVDEGEEAGAAKKLGNENGGVGLSLRVFQPLYALP